jgi:hypothetical protein
MDPLISSVVGLKQAEVASKIQFAVAQKIMQNDRMQGAAVMKLLDAATKGVNQAGDQLVAAATGLGATIDTYA